MNGGWSYGTRSRPAGQSLDTGDIYGPVHASSTGGGTIAPVQAGTGSIDPRVAWALSQQSASTPQATAGRYVPGRTGGSGSSPTAPTSGYTPGSTGGSGMAPRPGTSGTAADPCAQPTNPRLNQTSTDANGNVFVSVDPFFASSSARDAWIAAHPTCQPPPAYVQDMLQTNTITTPATAASAIPGWAWGLGAVAAAALVGGVVIATSSKKSRRSTRRSSRRSSRR